MIWGERCPTFAYPKTVEDIVPWLEIPIDEPMFLRLDRVDNRIQMNVYEDLGGQRRPVCDVTANGMPPIRDYTIDVDRDPHHPPCTLEIDGFNEVAGGWPNPWGFAWRLSVKNRFGVEHWFEDFETHCNDGASPSGQVLFYRMKISLGAPNTLPHWVHNPG